jgi:hypothetical protein
VLCSDFFLEEENKNDVWGFHIQVYADKDLSTLSLNGWIQTVLFCQSVQVSCTCRALVQEDFGFAAVCTDDVSEVTWMYEGKKVGGGRKCVMDRFPYVCASLLDCYLLSASRVRKSKVTFDPKPRLMRRVTDFFPVRPHYLCGKS